MHPPIATTSQPLVSCILPTRNRPTLVRQAIKYFDRQDYDNRELVILDDGSTDMTAELQGAPRLLYSRCQPRIEAIGTKRNILCAMARGAIIIHWDDDDWYSDTRLS